MSILIYISFFSILLPLIMGSIQWNKLPSSWAVLRWLLVASLSADMLSVVVGYLFRNSLPVLNLYSLVQFSVVAYIFSNFYNSKKIVLWVYVAYFIYFLLDMILLESPLRILTGPSIVGALLIIVLMLYFLYQQLVDVELLNIKYEPTFWIAFAFLLYYSGSLFVYLTYNRIIDLSESSIGGHVWHIHNFCNLLKNVLITVALWLNYKASKFSAVQ